MSYYNRVQMLKLNCINYKTDAQYIKLTPQLTQQDQFFITKVFNIML